MTPTGQATPRAKYTAPTPEAITAIGGTFRTHTMAAYWISRCIVHDPVQYKKYTDLVPDIIAAHGGRVLARGGRYQIMEGPKDFHRFVVIEFPTLEAGVKCFQSPEYTQAASFRRNGGGVVENVIVEDGDATP